MLNASVIDHTGQTIYRFESTAPKTFRMFRADGTEVAHVENMKVHLPGSDAVKAKKFVQKNTGRTGNTLV